jgi:hypothetical protein
MAPVPRKSTAVPPSVRLLSIEPRVALGGAVCQKMYYIELEHRELTCLSRNQFAGMHPGETVARTVCESRFSGVRIDAKPAFNRQARAVYHVSQFPRKSEDWRLQLHHVEVAEIASGIGDGSKYKYNLPDGWLTIDDCGLFID